MFYFDEINGKRILKSDLLQNLEHFFTTKETVIKSAKPEMENLITKNKELIKEYLQVKELVSPTQTHSANIDFAKIGKTDYPDTDALILNNPYQAVYLNFADCTPVILYDKKNNVGAVAHAGWKGTVQQIATKTIEIMQANPKDIIAVIGPAISICCYEVGNDVFEKLKKTVKSYNNLFTIKNNKIYVDLKGFNAQQLKELGVKEIDICPYCTSCNNDLFYSYRKENGTTNRHSAVIKLK